MNLTPKSLFARKDLGANLTILLLLSFGLGTATLLYTALDRLLLHPLAVAHPETLVRAGERHPPVTSWQYFPFQTFLALGHLRSFDQVAAEGDVETVLSLPASSQPIAGSTVSGSYFPMLGIPAELGRALQPADDQPGTSIPIVLSHHLWVSRFAGDPAILAKTLFLHGKPFTIVGVISQRFFGSRLDAAPDFWLPLSAQPLLSRVPLTAPEPDRHFSLLARLRPGVSLAQAQSEFANAYPAIQRLQLGSDPQRQGILVPIAEGSFALREPFRIALRLLLWGLAALLLMICASVASLLLSRAARRESEMALRIALGAGHARLIVGALVESLTLGSAGAGGAILTAFLLAAPLATLLPAGQHPLPISLFPDAHSILASVSLALLLSLAFGAIPAWRAAHVVPLQALRKASVSRRTGKLGRALIVLEVGCTLVLLISAGLLLHTFSVLEHTSPGFDVDHLLTFTVNLEAGGTSANLSPTFAETLRQRIQSLPGVRNASLADAAVMKRIGMKTSVAMTGQKIPPRSFLNTSFNAVSPTFFATLGTPLLSGRGFSQQDDSATKPTPTVINQAFARAYFPNQDPLGKSFGMGAPGEFATATNLVIAIAADSNYRSLREELLPIFYVPLGPHSNPNSYFFLYLRTSADPSTVIESARKVLFSMNSQIPFADVATMRQQVDESLWQERMLAALAVLFSVVAVLMASAGLYGLLAYDTRQRTREFGIRTAVGAQRNDVAKLVLFDLLHILIPGTLIGGAAFLLLARLIQSVLYGIQPLDPLSLAGALTTVALISCIAIGHPLWRAIHTDPAIVLRDE